jgi:hypothetical protein
MSSLLRRRVPQRLPVGLGLALIVLVLAPSASALEPLDTVTATGGGGNISDLNISAQSGTSGQNPSGTVSFTFEALGIVFHVGGQVTCLSVTGLTWEPEPPARRLQRC